jgi:hypothetical protein
MTGCALEIAKFTVEFAEAHMQLGSRTGRRFPLGSRMAKGPLVKLPRFPKLSPCNPHVCQQGGAAELIREVSSFMEARDCI